MDPERIKELRTIYGGGRPYTHDAIIIEALDAIKQRDGEIAEAMARVKDLEKATRAAMIALEQQEDTIWFDHGTTIYEFLDGWLNHDKKDFPDA